jgi:nucleotide-binding universal stress UspA family protein
MPFKSILTHVDTTDLLDARLAVAAAWAREAGGRVIGVGAQMLPRVFYTGDGYIDPDTFQAINDRINANLTDAEARFRKATEGLTSVWRSRIEDPARVVIDEARGAELVVASQRPAHADDSSFADPGDLVMGAGLPVLVLPPNVSHVAVRRVVVGWKNTPQARAALSAALPVLQAADRVELTRVKVADELGAMVELEDVAQRLSLEGVEVGFNAHGRSKDAVADDLLRLAHERHADLVVVGAYAHARLTEWVFGGVTHDLLTKADLPVLFAR